MREVTIEGKDSMRSSMMKITMLNKACNGRMDVNESSRNILGTMSTRVDGTHMYESIFVIQDVSAY